MQSVVDTFKAWQPHPFVDHFTVALIIVGILADLIASLVSSRLWLRYLALTLMILGAVAAWGSNLTGGWEAERVWDHVTGPAKDVLKTHAELGDWLPWIAVALALWRLGVQFLGFVAASRPLYLIVAILAGIAVIYQGHEGAELVYTYGVGTQTMPIAAVPTSQAPAASAIPAPPTALPKFVPSIGAPSPEASHSPAAPGSSAEIPPAAATTPPGTANSPSPAGSAETPVPPAAASVPPSPAATPSGSSSGTPLTPPTGKIAPSSSASTGPSSSRDL
jgi:uncharacterized membrane protein